MRSERQRDRVVEAIEGDHRERSSASDLSAPRSLRPRPLGVDISVRDTSIGIPVAELPHIFDALRQVDGSASRSCGGAGLGLTVVKRLAALLSATLHVDNCIGEGSTFTLWLPARAPVRAPGAPLNA